MLDIVARGGLVLLGCGKMGTALLTGWLAAGVPAASVWVIEPNPTDWLKASGVHLNKGVPPAPAVALLAVKPQMMGAALPALQALGNGTTLFISIAAGTSIATFEAALGPRTPIVRTMPNTPAMVGRGITGICANAAGQSGLALARALMLAVGAVVELDGEHQIDAVTAISGSGPAYVFYFMEALQAAAHAQGFAPDVARKLAYKTFEGAVKLALQSEDDAATLRKKVTSKGGTTERAINALETSQVRTTIIAAAAAAAARSRELGEES